MKQRKRTTISILREILGPLTGSESGFAGVVGLSTSWVNKVSYAKRSITPKAAAQVSMKTGVSPNWLLCGNTEAPPVELDEKSPYSRESYDRYVEKAHTIATESPELGAAQNMVTIIGSFIAGIESGKGKSAANDLWECAKHMAIRYGEPVADEGTWRKVAKFQDEIQKIARRVGLQSDASTDSTTIESEEAEIQPKPYFGESYRKLDV